MRHLKYDWTAGGRASIPRDCLSVPKTPSEGKQTTKPATSPHFSPASRLARDYCAWRGLLGWAGRRVELAERLVAEWADDGECEESLGAILAGWERSAQTGGRWEWNNEANRWRQRSARHERGPAGGSEVRQHALELRAIRIALRKREPDLPGRHPNARPDLQ